MMDGRIIKFFGPYTQQQQHTKRRGKVEIFIASAMLVSLILNALECLNTKFQLAKVFRSKIH